MVKNSVLIFVSVLVLTAILGGLYLSQKPSIKTMPNPKSQSPSPTVSSTPSPKPKPTPTLRPKSTISWGTYTGWNVSDVTDFENKVGKKINLLATFVHWGNNKDFPVDLADFAKTNKKTLVIYWEAMDYNVKTADDPRFAYDAILQGKWDSYISAFAKSTQDYGGSIILIPFEEANGGWYPWSGTVNGNSPKKHVLAFRYLKKAFAGVANVKFAWDVNHVSEPDTEANSIDKYYPGDAYVDYVGVNGFNFDDPWVSFADTFDSALKILETYGKPIYIFSTASAPGPGKPAWIRNAFNEEIPKHPMVAGWIWFNENKERDWRVWSDSASLKAFKEVLP